MEFHLDLFMLSGYNYICLPKKCLIYALLKENGFFIFFPPLLMHKAKKVSTLSNKILFG
jgi:hypothetical protein